MDRGEAASPGVPESTGSGGQAAKLGGRDLMEAMLYENRALHDRLRVLEEERTNRQSTNSSMESVRDIQAAEGPLATSPGTERMPESAESPSVVPVQAAVTQQVSGSPPTELGRCGDASPAFGALGCRFGSGINW